MNAGGGGGRKHKTYSYLNKQLCTPYIACKISTCIMYALRIQSFASTGHCHNVMERCSNARKTNGKLKFGGQFLGTAILFPSRHRTRYRPVCDIGGMSFQFLFAETRVIPVPVQERFATPCIPVRGCREKLRRLKVLGKQNSPSPTTASGWTWYPTTIEELVRCHHGLSLGSARRCKVL